MLPNDDVELLQQLIAHGGTQAFSLVPAALKKVIVEKQWQRRVDKNGKPFASFEAFVTHRLWQGLESTIDDLRVFCRRHADVVRLILEAMEPGRERRGSTEAERANRVDNINSTSSKGGTSALYTLKRLKRERPDLFQEVIGGGKSANAAAIEAGWRKRLSDLDRVIKLLRKLSPLDRQRVRTMLDEIETSKKLTTQQRESLLL